LYAVNTHDSAASETPGNASVIDGKAMLTIVTSRKTRNTASEVTARTAPGR
jgi:hypothetical protein